MNIHLVPTDDLIKELLDRFDHAVFSGAKVGTGRPDAIFTARKWIGNSATCAGLCMQLVDVINDDHFRRTNIDGEESIDA